MRQGCLRRRLILDITQTGKVGTVPTLGSKNLNTKTLLSASQDSSPIAKGSTIHAPETLMTSHCPKLIRGINIANQTLDTLLQCNKPYITDFDSIEKFETIADPDSVRRQNKRFDRCTISGLVTYYALRNQGINCGLYSIPYLHYRIDDKKQVGDPHIFLLAEDSNRKEILIDTSYMQNVVGDRIYSKSRPGLEINFTQNPHLKCLLKNQHILLDSPLHENMSPLAWFLTSKSPPNSDESIKTIIEQGFKISNTPIINPWIFNRADYCDISRSLGTLDKEKLLLPILPWDEARSAKNIILNLS